MGVSIKDIAKAAGVSHSTVSRALADSPLVAEETKRRVRCLAKKMGYSPSAIARGLVTKRTQTVGLVVTTIADPFVSEVVRGIEETALDNGYSVILCDSNAEPQREITAVRTLREKRVDGIIVTASRVGNLYLPLLEEVEVPIVLINNQRAGRYVYSVATDNVHGGEMITNHLLELGHRRIGYITGPEGASSSLDRLEGYKRALRAHRIKFTDSVISSGNGCPDGGERGMRQLLALSPPPTAVFCYNDMTAVGAMAEARRMGFRVPQDFSVVGFDDIAFAAYVDPPLTTVEQRKYEMGQMAMGMVLDILAGADTVPDITLQGQLVVRGSSGQPGQG
jgi:LacI family repressor for deo operon, udp, cdd, tsx, nupC, and nupG